MKWLLKEMKQALDVEHLGENISWLILDMVKFEVDIKAPKKKW